MILLKNEIDDSNNKNCTKNRNNVTCNTICLGITRMQSEPLVNDSKTDEGFTFVTQLDSKRRNGPIKGSQ